MAIADSVSYKNYSEIKNRKTVEINTLAMRFKFFECQLEIILMVYTLLEEQFINCSCKHMKGGQYVG